MFNHITSLFFQEVAWSLFTVIFTLHAYWAWPRSGLEKQLLLCYFLEFEDHNQEVNGYDPLSHVTLKNSYKRKGSFAHP